MRFFLLSVISFLILSSCNSEVNNSNSIRPDFPDSIQLADQEWCKTIEFDSDSAIGKSNSTALKQLLISTDLQNIYKKFKNYGYTSNVLNNGSTLYTADANRQNNLQTVKHQVDSNKTVFVFTLARNNFLYSNHEEITVVLNKKNRLTELQLDGSQKTIISKKTTYHLLFKACALNP